MEQLKCGKLLYKVIQLNKLKVFLIKKKYLFFLNKKVSTGNNLLTFTYKPNN